jgi:hypothetical protein
MEHKTIYTKHDFCKKCGVWTPHYVQHESNNVERRTVTYKTSCVVHEEQALKETKTVQDGTFYLLMSDSLKPVNLQTL